MSSELDALIRELEEAARDLRADDIDPDRAAAIVDRCAEIAVSLSGELDHAVREAERDAPGSGQERLL